MPIVLPNNILEFLVPFVLTFALTLGALTVSKVFKHIDASGKEKPQTNVNFLIALALSVLAVSSPTYAQMLFEWAPILATMFIVVFVLVFLKNMFLKEGHKAEIETLVAIALLFLILFQFGSSLPLPSGTYIRSDDILIAAGVIFVIAIIVIGKRLGDKKPEEPQQGQQRPPGR